MATLNTALSLKDLPPPPTGKTGWPWTEENQPLAVQMANGSEWPRISIVTPSYNYGQFIEETIRSVLLQGYPNLEYIIIDGGSTDNTVEIIRKYEKYLTYWVSEPDGGQTDAINKGYRHCTGDLFVWLNADDAYASSTCLKNVGKIYKQGYQLIVGECLNVDENDQYLKITKDFNGYAPLQTFDQYLRFWSFIPFPQPAVFIAKELTDNAFPLDKNLYGTMDYQMFLRVLDQNPKSIAVKQTWVKFKYHGGNKTMNTHAGYSEFYEVAMIEAKKQNNLWRRIEFQISAKDNLIISSLMNSEPKFLKILIFVLSSPSLLRWPLFWKLFIKSFLGKDKYLTFKKIVKNV